MMWKSSQKPEARLAAEEAEAGKTVARLVELDGELNAHLLNGNTAEIEKIDAETAALKKAAERRQRTIVLLREQVESEARAAAVKRKADHGQRVISKFTERDRVVTGLETSIANTVKLFRQAIKLGEEIGAAWPFDDGQLSGTCLTGRALRELICYELYRKGTIPFFGGNPFEVAVVAFPGGVPPSEDMRLQPEKITPISQAISEASRYGASVIRQQISTKTAS